MSNFEEDLQAKLIISESRQGVRTPASNLAPVLLGPIVNEKMTAFLQQHGFDVFSAAEFDLHNASLEQLKFEAYSR